MCCLELVAASVLETGDSVLSYTGPACVPASGLPSAGVKSQLINRLLHRRSTIGQAERYTRTATDFVRYRLPELREKVRQRGLDPTGEHRCLLSSGRAAKHDRQADATIACLFPHCGHTNHQCSTAL